MLLDRDAKNGVALSGDEVEQLVVMYRSGNYSIKEMCDEFGITRYKFDVYMAMAYKLGLMPDDYFFKKRLLK